MAEKTLDALPRLRFHYIKGQQFRVIHVDGALGGITPRGLIHCAVYSERPAIPQTTEHDISPEGRLGAQVSQEGRQGVVREMDVDLIMSKQTAIELRDWLDGRVKELEQLESRSDPATENQRQHGS
jgi:hypothetical protein